MMRNHTRNPRNPGRNPRKNLRPLAAFLALVLLTLSPAGMLAQTQQIPAHPRELKYAPLTYTPPKRDQYRHVLSNGAVVYLVEDHDLPLVNISTTVRTGSYLDPAGKEGLAALTGTQMRIGGTTSKTAEEFDEACRFSGGKHRQHYRRDTGHRHPQSAGEGCRSGPGALFRHAQEPAFSGGSNQAREESAASEHGAAQRSHGRD